jgi:hypothetical protein
MHLCVSPTDAGHDGDTHKCMSPAGEGRRGGEAAERPGHARNVVCRNTVSAWAGALRAAGGRKPSRRGVLTRSRSGPPAGGGEATPSGPRGRFQPAPVAPAVRPRGGVPAVRSGPPEAPSRTPTFRRPSHPGPATPADGHAPLDRPAPPVRSPAGRPPQRWGDKQYGRGLGGGGPNRVENFQGFDFPAVCSASSEDRRGRRQAWSWPAASSSRVRFSVDSSAIL